MVGEKKDNMTEVRKSEIKPGIIGEGVVMK